MVNFPIEFLITAPSPVFLPLYADKVPKIAEGKICCLRVFGQSGAERRFLWKWLVGGKKGTDTVTAGGHALAIEKVDIDIEIIGKGEGIGNAGADFDKAVDIEETPLIRQAIIKSPNKRLNCQRAMSLA